MQPRIRIHKFHSYVERTPSTKHFISLFLAFTAISVLASITYLLSQSTPLIPTTILFTPATLPPVLIASFGASAVLLYSVPRSPLAQPKPAFFGQVAGAVVGVTVKQVFTYAGASQNLMWLEASLAVGLAIFAMSLTRTIHPPAGATALIAVVGGPSIVSLGYWFVLMPVALGMFIMIVIAYLGNQAFGIKYPDYWIYPPHTKMISIAPEESVSVDHDTPE